MVRSNCIIAFILLFSLFKVEAQVNRYMVFFSDKNDSPFSITQPKAFLSDRAIMRRMKQGISIDGSDLPVNPTYISGLEAIGVKVYFTTKWLNGALIQEDQALIGRIKSLPYVSKVEYVAPGERLGKSINNSRVKPFSGGISQSEKTTFQNEMLGIDDMHKLNYRGEGMIVAVFDGGFLGVDKVEAFRHIFEENRVMATYDLVANSANVYQYDGHGSQVLSAISGYQAGTFTGTAYKSSLILCVTEDIDTEYRIEEYNWLFAAELADSVGVDVINTSLGYNQFDDETMNYTHDDLDGKTAIITQAANLAGKKGIFLVAAIGNEGDIPWVKLTPPSDSPHVLSVGSVESSGKLAAFSSLGPTQDGRIKPDVVALGGSVALIESNGKIVNSNGTSFSAPLVAGLATGVWQAKPTLNTEELMQVIRLSGDRAKEPDNLYGYGVPDFLKASGNPVLSIDQIHENKIKVYPNPFRGDKIFIDISGKYYSDQVGIELYDLLGNMLSNQVSLSNTIDGIFVLDIEPNISEGTYLLRVLSEKLTTEVSIIMYR